MHETKFQKIAFACISIFMVLVAIAIILGVTYRVGYIVGWHEAKAGAALLG